VGHGSLSFSERRNARAFLDDIRSVTRKFAQAIPLHQDFIDQYCSALTEVA
jgi:hypothetical protein